MMNLKFTTVFYPSVPNCRRKVVCVCVKGGLLICVLHQNINVNCRYIDWREINRSDLYVT